MMMNFLENVGWIFPWYQVLTYCRFRWIRAMRTKIIDMKKYKNPLVLKRELLAMQIYISTAMRPSSDQPREGGNCDEGKRKLTKNQIAEAVHLQWVVSHLLLNSLRSYGYTEKGRLAVKMYFCIAKTIILRTKWFFSFFISIIVDLFILVNYWDFRKN